jgi:hypothetical protein
MRISDTLDQLLHSLLVTSSADSVGPAGADASRPGASAPSATADDRPPLAIDLEAAAAEVAIKQAHELDGPSAAGPPTVTSPDSTAPASARREFGELARLQASAGTIENLGLGFHLGAAIERIAIASGQGSEGGVMLREATWLIERYISLLEQRPVGADLHASSVRLARTGKTIAGLHELRAELATVQALVPPAAAEPPRQTTPEPQPEPTPTRAATAGVDAPTPVEQPPIVQELPSIRREIFVTTVRAGIAVVAVIAIVLVLTLIAQWR